MIITLENQLINTGQHPCAKSSQVIEITMIITLENQLIEYVINHKKCWLSI